MEGALGTAIAGLSGAPNGPRYSMRNISDDTAAVRNAAMLMRRAGCDLDRSSQLIDANYGLWALSSAPDYRGVYINEELRTPSL
jgi:hypothetical protein